MLTLFFAIAGIHLVALATPGPDFFFVSQVSASHSRQDAIKAVLGIVLGVLVWAGIALLGLHVILQKMAWLQTLIMAIGGSYLCYLAFLLIRSALRQLLKTNNTISNQPLAIAKNKHIFIKGLLTNLSNPKALIYFGSIFSALITDDVSLEMRWWILALILAETFLWFMLVMTFFSLPVMRKGYLRAAKWVDGIAGIIFTCFGTALIYKAVQSI